MGSRGLALPTLEQVLRAKHEPNGIPYPFFPASFSDDDAGEEDDPRIRYEFRNAMFGWDTGIIAMGLHYLGQDLSDAGLTEDANMIKKLLWQQAANQVHLVQKYGYVPNSSNLWTNRTQPPLFPSTVLLAADHASDAWLMIAYDAINVEYHNMWATTNDGFSRYRTGAEALPDLVNTNPEHYTAMQASGWDNTLRFGNEAHYSAPVDLNSFLVLYEESAAEIARRLGRNDDVRAWRRRAADRKSAVQRLWNEEGFFFDLNLRTGEVADTWTLAGMVPLYAGIPTRQQAARVHENLQRFETEQGLAVTEPRLHHQDCQWGWPNMWPMVSPFPTLGLRRYGYHAAADRITLKVHAAMEPGHWAEKVSAVAGQGRVDDPRYRHQKDLTASMMACYATGSEMRRSHRRAA